MSDIQIVLLSLFAAMSVGLGVWSLWALIVDMRSGAYDADEMFTDAPVFRFMLPTIQTIGRRLEPLPALESSREELRTNLKAAGKQDAITPDEFIATQILSALGGLGGGLIFWRLLDISPEYIVAFPLLGYILPILSLKDAVKKRQKAIRRAVPYTLDLLTLAVEAGLDFTAALARVGTKPGDHPLAPEIKRLVRDLSMGKPRSEALKDLADRTKVEELGTVVSALVQADELGASLGPVLRVQASEMRRRRFDRAEKQAQEAPVKMVFPLVFFIMPVVFLVVFSPIVIRFYTENPL